MADKWIHKQKTKRTREQNARTNQQVSSVFACEAEAMVEMGEHSEGHKVQCQRCNLGRWLASAVDLPASRKIVRERGTVTVQNPISLAKAILQ